MTVRNVLALIFALSVRTAALSLSADRDSDDSTEECGATEVVWEDKATPVAQKSGATEAAQKGGADLTRAMLGSSSVKDNIAQATGVGDAVQFEVRAGEIECCFAALEKGPKKKMVLSSKMIVSHIKRTAAQLELGAPHYAARAVVFLRQQVKQHTTQIREVAMQQTN